MAEEPFPTAEIPGQVSSPLLNIPAKEQCVTVKLIVAGLVKGPNINALLSPHIQGHDVYSGPSYSFLIEHHLNSQTRRLLFDLGIRKDWKNLSPVTVKRIKTAMWDLQVEHNVEEILEIGGVSRNDVEGIIWSHWHWDHIGDPSQFPSHVDLIVGPGFKQNLMPGWPTNSLGVIQESDYRSRRVIEVDFTDAKKSVKLGSFDSFDYFGDGSFYLLDSPGHAIGHLCGLARTSASPPTFIFLGADTCHHAGEFRPTTYIPLPNTIDLSLLSSERLFKQFGSHMCPGSVFLNIHRSGMATEPFYTLPGKGISHNRDKAIESTAKMIEFDAAENVFVCIAHDSTLLKIVDLYPKSLNAWFAKGWAGRAKWAFLHDFENAVEANLDYSLTRRRPLDP